MNRNRKGIDVSHHQGTINWQQVAISSIEWASVKATEGTTFVDPMFHKNVRDALEEGLEVLPYHFAHHRNDPDEEAMHFLHVIGSFAGQSVVLDWEWRLGEIDSQDQAKWINQFATHFPNMIIYCSRYPARWLDKLVQYPFWIAAPRNTGWPTLERNEVMGWQYNWKGQVPGIHGPVDLDYIRQC